MSEEKPRNQATKAVKKKAKQVPKADKIKESNKKSEHYCLEAMKQYDADLLIYAGPIGRPYDDHVMDQILKVKKRSKNVILWLSTFGGDPHAAYRISRVLQSQYRAKGGEVIIFVTSSCMSAGTLITLCADKIYLSEHTELGPLDIQLIKDGEVGERTSGLTPIQAMDMLSYEMIKTYSSQFTNCRRSIGMPTKMAADIAAELSSQVMGRLYSQLDPLKITEVDRAMNIVSHYAERIKSKNVRVEAVRKLLHEYPAHNFVIDPEECASSIFVKVEEITQELRRLEVEFGDEVKHNLYKSQPMVILFSKSELQDESNSAL